MYITKGGGIPYDRICKRIWEAADVAVGSCLPYRWCIGLWPDLLFRVGESQRILMSMAKKQPA